MWSITDWKQMIIFHLGYYNPNVVTWKDMILFPFIFVIIIVAHNSNYNFIVFVLGIPIQMWSIIGWKHSIIFHLGYHNPNVVTRKDMILFLMIFVIFIVVFVFL